MKPIILALCLSGCAFAAESAIDPERAANTVILDETGTKNLRIETTEVEETEFEESVFSLGRIEAIPSSRSGVSSRVAGRIIELKAAVGDSIEAGQEIARLEARVAGNPPPVLTLTSAGKGLVTKSNVALGEPLEPEASLLEITDLSSVYAVARVPEHLAGKMKTGTVAHIKVAALPDEKFDGELLRFGTEADRVSGTLDAIFKLANPNLTLRPGMRSEFSIVLGKREGVMSVPRAALQGDAANRILYVKDFDIENAFVKTKVEVGRITDSRVEVISGLLPVDEVVTRGAYSLAFAGGGSVSLKEALDAAHGHEHNEDGSELTAEQKAAKAAENGGGHSHEGESGGSMIWKLISGVLALIVVGQAFLKGKSNKDHAALAAKPEARV
jgi:multidrug efflux pump subunit AcrA (membrane-fusion protein)